MWVELCRMNKDNFNIIPNDYEKIKEKVFKIQES